MGDRSGLGVLLGVGALAGLGVWFFRNRTATTPGSPRERFFAPPFPAPTREPQRAEPDVFIGPARFSPLVERWRPEVTRLAEDLPVEALLEWIRIESGGDMCSIGGPTEVGIFQLFFLSDAKYGATLEGLREICKKSDTQNPRDISWMTPSDLDMEVGAGIRKVMAARDTVRREFAENGVTWPETSFDFGSAVKQIHATPAVITELLSKITRRDGAPPSSWPDLRQKVMSFPVDQMGSGLQRLAKAPSKRGLANRLEDTMRNAEEVGRMWAASSQPSMVAG